MLSSFIILIHNNYLFKMHTDALSLYLFFPVKKHFISQVGKYLFFLLLKLSLLLNYMQNIEITDRNNK